MTSDSAAIQVVEVIKEVPVERIVTQEVMVERVVEKVVTAAPAPAQPAARAAQPSAGTGALQDIGDTQQQVTQFAIQKRIIIYTVDMTLEIVDVATSVDEVGAMAREMGGWIVSTSRAERHLGFISVRVPAERLDEAVARLRGMAVDVQAENASSRGCYRRIRRPDLPPWQPRGYRDRSAAFVRPRRYRRGSARRSADTLASPRRNRGHQGAHKLPRADIRILADQRHTGAGTAGHGHRRGRRPDRRSRPAGQVPRLLQTAGRHRPLLVRLGLRRRLRAVLQRPDGAHSR